MNDPAPPPPEGYKLIIDRGVTVASLLKGDVVFDHALPEYGWCLLTEDERLHPKSPISVAVLPLEKRNLEEQPPTQESVLQEAERLVNGDRQQSYGDASESFERIADFWHTYLKTKLKDTEHISAKDVASMMILMKVSRSVTSSKRDSWVDIAGYAELGSKLDDLS